MINKKNTIPIAIFFIITLFSQSATAGWFDWLFPQSTYAQTKYPIILVGGAILAVDNIGPIDVFYQIPGEIEDNGGKAYVTVVSGAESNEARGEQLARLAEEVMALENTDKVNFITISMGGPTARYVASVYPQMVASVSTLDGGHQGVPLGDLFVNGQELAPNVMEVFFWFGNGLMAFTEWMLTGDTLPVDTAAVAWSESTPGSQEFNALHPEGAPFTDCGDGPEIGSNGVYYYSMMGNKAFTNPFDPADYILWALHTVMFEDGVESDGAVGVCSSHWGKVIRDDYPMNHVDLVNHLFSINAPGFDPVNVYLQQANRLKNKGM